MLLRWVIIGILAPCMALTVLANAVPTTVEELTKKADLVVDVEVVARTTVPNGRPLACFEGLVTRWIKGGSNRAIKVCPNDINEMDPPPPQLGAHYRMYLRGSPVGLYEPFSYAGFARIPSQ